MAQEVSCDTVSSSDCHKGLELDNRNDIRFLPLKSITQGSFCHGFLVCVGLGRTKSFHASYCTAKDNCFLSLKIIVPWVVFLCLAQRRLEKCLVLGRIKPHYCVIFSRASDVGASETRFLVCCARALLP